MYPEHNPVGLDIQFDTEPNSTMWNEFLARLAAAGWDMKAALGATPERSRMWFAEHTISSTLLHVLASDSSALVRRLVADSAYTTPIDLEVLAHDADVNVRRSVALNYNVPQGTLTRLAQDKDSRVRRVVALHPHVTSDLLSFLALDDDPHVRRSVATNLSTNLSLIQKLSDDQDNTVRCVARARLNWLQAGSRKG